MSNKHKQPHLGHWLFVLVFFAASSFMVGKNPLNFQASVIPTKQAAPYDGLALPILKTPNWVALTTEQWKADYDQIPAEKLVSIPSYDPNQLKTPTEQLSWSKESDKAIRNAKITFSTPYMGNYKLDGFEYAGSHLAVDIKIPNNTPIYAIGNGVVVKVSTQSTGFGVHIVLKHENFPSLNDPNVKTTYYSSYNHLGSVLISEGSTVTKGQQIGLSGHSGTASTPHLHFQIDNEQAPWHPYWPFTFQEAQTAGYSFDGAVNAGLGKDKAILTTINPMLFVQKYLNASVTPVSPVPAAQPTPAPIPATTPAPTVPAPAAPTPSPAPTTVPTTPAVPAPVTEPSATPAPIPSQPAASFKVSANEKFVIGVSQALTIKAVDSTGEIVKNYNAPQGVSILLELGGATLSKNYLVNEDFIQGVAKVTFTPTSAQGLRFKVIDGQISGLSEVLQGEIFSDVSAGDKSYEAINFLKDYGVIGGYPDGTFKPDAVVSRVEALKFILKGVNLKLQQGGKLPFKDTDVSQWYADYVATAYNSSIVGGYPDFTFKPGNTVNRVEFLKMLLLATDIEFNTVVTTDIFADVPKESWFAPYAQYAKDKNLIDSTGDFFKPEEGMTRAEVAEAIYRMVALKLSGLMKYSNGLAVSDIEAEQYFRSNNT